MNRNITSGVRSAMRSVRLLVNARQCLIGAALILLSAAISPGVAQADFVAGDYRATGASVTRHTVTLPQGLKVQTITVQMPIGVAKVSLPDTTGHKSIVGNLQIIQSGNEFVLSGWHAVRLAPRASYGLGVDSHNRHESKAQLQKIFLQEIRITLPHSAAGGGWDVRSLERELERLGVKIKPKPIPSKPSVPGSSLQTPSTQLSG